MDIFCAPNKLFVKSKILGGLNSNQSKHYVAKGIAALIYFHLYVPIFLPQSTPLGYLGVSGATAVSHVEMGTGTGAVVAQVTKKQCRTYFL